MKIDFWFDILQFFNLISFIKQLEKHAFVTYLESTLYFYGLGICTWKKKNKNSNGTLMFATNLIGSKGEKIMNLQVHQKHRNGVRRDKDLVTK